VGRRKVLRVICGLGQRVLSGIVIRLALQVALGAGAAEVYTRQANWVETVLTTRAALMAAMLLPLSARSPSCARCHSV